MESRDRRWIAVEPFEIAFAKGATGRDEEFELRYRLFVEEHRWLSPDGLDGRRECDGFDAAAVAFIVRDRATREIAACQRLILPERLDGTHRTMLEELAPQLDVNVADLPPTDWGELSRTCIAQRFRCGSASCQMPAINVFKYATVALAVAYRRERLFSISEAPIARLIRRVGVHMRRIGRPVEYHGLRIPFEIQVPQAFASVPDDMRGVFAELVDAARRLELAK